MALNTTLLDLRTMLKAEIGDNLSSGTALDTTYTQKLALAQKLLVSELDFSYLQEQWDVSVGAGGRYVAMPTTTVRGSSYLMDYSRQPEAYVFFNQLYIGLEYGIGVPEFNYQNSDLNQGVDPIQRWRWTHKGVGAANQQVEFWPMPQTAQTVRFYGQRALNALAVDADTADLDDVLLVLTVAVDILSRRKGADAATRLASASRRLQQIRGSLPQRTPDKCVFGQGHGDGPPAIRRAPMRIVAVHG